MQTQITVWRWTEERIGNVYGPWLREQSSSPFTQDDIDAGRVRFVDGPPIKIAMPPRPYCCGNAAIVQDLTVALTYCARCGVVLG